MFLFVSNNTVVKTGLPNRFFRGFRNSLIRLVADDLNPATNDEIDFGDR